MSWKIEEILETIRMTEVEHLDIRTVTLGISLRDIYSDDFTTMKRRLYDKITSTARRHVATAEKIEDRFGISIANKRISITPLSIVGERLSPEQFTELAVVLDKAAAEVGVDFLAGYSALVQKGMTPGESSLIESIPATLATTERICSSVNLGTTKAGINMDAVRLMGEIIKDTAARTADRDGIGCAKLVVFCNVPEDNPFVAGAFHGITEGAATINVGISGPGVVLNAINELPDEADFGELSEAIKRMSFKITRVGELIGRQVANEQNFNFGIVDISLAPTPVIGDSVGAILESMGLESVGAHGTTAALALLNDSVKKGGMMASSYVGGLSGAFIPVSEDDNMIKAAERGDLSLEKLESMTCVCSVGLDMVAVPGDTPASAIAGIIADEMAIGMINNKTTAVRIIPAPGKGMGDQVDYGGLLGRAPIMAVRNLSNSIFIARGGRIPAPTNALTN